MPTPMAGSASTLISTLNPTADTIQPVMVVPTALPKITQTA